MSFVAYRESQTTQTLSAWNVYRTQINLGTAGTQTLFTTLSGMGNFCPTEVWLHVDGAGAPTSLNFQIGVSGTPTSIVNDAVGGSLSGLSQFNSYDLTIAAGTSANGAWVSPSTAVIFTRVSGTAAQLATVFVGGFYDGARDGR